MLSLPTGAPAASGACEGCCCFRGPSSTGTRGADAAPAPAPPAEDFDCVLIRLLLLLLLLLLIPPAVLCAKGTYGCSTGGGACRPANCSSGW